MDARTPLAILSAALAGSLLRLPFAPIVTGTARPQSARRSPVIGIAWASISHGKPVTQKSVPLAKFLGIFDGFRAEVISFQRHLSEQNREVLCDRFTGCTALADSVLDAKDQTDVVREVQKLDCMVTISTTTAHITASLGVPVILLTATRPHQQWFWRAQQQHGRCFYPSVKVILGGPHGQGWWRNCLEPANNALNATLGDSASGC